MATPKPGEIRCPTCHRSTPPATFCTQCGSAIPADARIRPRGMDRDELQDRIRARRSGGDPYRRGAEAEEGTGIYEKFEPDPADAKARRAQRHDERRRDDFDDLAAAPPPPPPAGPPPDVTRDGDDWPPAEPVAPVFAPPPAEPAEPAAAAPYEEPANVDNFDDVAYGEPAYDYAYEDWEEQPRRSGTGALAIIGFLGLGVLALVAGAVLAGVLGDGGIGAGDATPTPAVSVAASLEPTAVASAAPSASAVASSSPGASGGPIVFPDGFTAEAQPCLPGSAGGSGCDSNGVSNGGVVDIWVGFTNGNSSDVIGATLVAPDNSTVDGSIDLDRIGCGQACNGWTYFPFRNLGPGTYEVQITRNGQPAGSTTFEVT
jgi:hypothetical protein